MAEVQASFSSGGGFEPTRVQSGRSRIPTLEVSGPPREQGRQYGEAARQQIGVSVEYYREAFTHWTGLKWPQVLGRVGDWVPVIKAYAADLLTEIEGIAEGSARRFEEILTLNVRGEIGYDPTLRHGPGEGCTTFALLADATGDGHVYAGQNWDWHSAVQSTVLCLRVVSPPKPTIIMELEAGQIGRHGVNSAGLPVFVNGLGEPLGGRGADAQLRVPQPFIRRRLLESPTMSGALSVVVFGHVQVPTTFVVTHRDGFAIALESTPTGTGWVYPGNGVLVHGNHYQSAILMQHAADYRPFSPDSLYRVPLLERALAGCRDASDSQSVRDVIASRADCRTTSVRRNPCAPTRTKASMPWTGGRQCHRPSWI